MITDFNAYPISVSSYPTRGGRYFCINITIDGTLLSGEKGKLRTIVTGEITLKAANGTYNRYDYCDVWRFENGKIAELKAFVIEKKS